MGVRTFGSAGAAAWLRYQATLTDEGNVTPTLHRVDVLFGGTSDLADDLPDRQAGKSLRLRLL